MKLITTEIEIALNPWFYNYNSESIRYHSKLMMGSIFPKFPTSRIS